MTLRDKNVTRLYALNSFKGNEKPVSLNMVKKNLNFYHLLKCTVKLPNLEQ